MNSLKYNSPHILLGLKKNIANVREEDKTFTPTNTTFRNHNILIEVISYLQLFPGISDEETLNPEIETYSITKWEWNA